jgi:hypothetical protein
MNQRNEFSAPIAVSAAPPQMIPAVEGDHDISLLDFWTVIARRRIWFVATAMLSIAVAGAAAVFVSPRYMSAATLALGQVDGIGLLEQPQVMMERLKSLYDLREDGQPAGSSLPHMLRIEFQKTGENRIFTFSAVGRTPEEAKDFLQNAVDSLLARHERLYDAALNVQRERLAMLNGALSQFEERTNLLKEQLRNLKSRDSATQALLALEYASLVGTEPGLRTQILDTKLALLPPRTIPSQLVLVPTLAKGPLRPRPTLYMGMGVIGGLMLGLIVALLAEFLANARREMRLRASSSK